MLNFSFNFVRNYVKMLAFHIEKMFLLYHSHHLKYLIYSLKFEFAYFGRPTKEDQPVTFRTSTAKVHSLH